MFSKIKYYGAISLIVVVSAIFSTISAAQSITNPLMSLNLTDKQLTALTGVISDYNQKQFKIISFIESKIGELRFELKRQDRFATERKAQISARKVNSIVKELSALYGQLLKTRVEYLIKTKEVLTPEQKEQLVTAFDFEMEVLEDLTYYEELNLLDLGLDLSRKQIQDILRYDTEMRINELRIQLKVDYKILDIETALARDKVNSKKVNRLILDIADLATKLLHNRVTYFLKTKDVLTIDQKNELLHLIIMTQ
jgi:Spy/CpxP family protein refolding chaperone